MGSPIWEEREMKNNGRNILEEVLHHLLLIKCPYCEQWFPKLTQEQYRDSAELNVLKWALVPA
jgi:hypothetical protein